MVFCDLDDSERIAVRLGAEPSATLLERFHQLAGTVARRHEGELTTVGDAVALKFGGGGIRHEDDPERAVRAALDLVAASRDLPASRDLAASSRDQPDIPITASVGVHTGLAPGPGAPLDIAAHLQAIAAPGTVALSEQTLRAVRGLFVTEELGTHAIEGIEQQVQVYRAAQPSGVRSRLDDAAGAHTPLVNRESHLAHLLELWELARAGSGHGVLISGEPGIGKSRLVYELRQRVGEGAHTWLECACSAYTQHSAFRPVVDLVEQGLGFRSGDAPAQRLARIVLAVEQLEIDDPDAVALLAQALGISPAAGYTAPEMSPSQQRHRTLELFRKWALTLAALQPTVVLAEDIQWADASSLELFTRLIEQSSDSPLLLVGTARPEFEPRWPSTDGFTLIDLRPLREDEVQTLVRALSSERQLPDAVVEHVAHATDGIPLFAEELGKTLLASKELTARAGGLHLTDASSGAAELATRIDIPATLYDTLMARLDRLSRRRPAAKRVAQRAAVIGSEFDQALVEQVVGLEPEVVGNGLARLVEDDLLVRRGQPPHATYAFRHALIQDAAYRSLMRLQRRDLHARTADELARRRAREESSPAPEVIARHYEAADLHEQAIALYREAADHAVRQSAHNEALAHLERAIALTTRLPDDPSRHAVEADLQTALGSSIIALRGYADPRIETAYQRAHTLYEQLGDRRQVGYAFAGLSLFHFNHGEVERGVRLAKHALAIAREEGDDALHVLAGVQVAVPTFYRGDFAVALEHVEDTVARYDRERHRWLGYRYGADQGVAAHSFAALALMRIGHPDRALQRTTAAVELAEALASPYDIAYARFFETAVHWNRGDVAAQAATATKVLELAKEHDFELFTGLARMFGAAAQAFATADPASLEELYAGSAVAAQTGFRGGLPAFVCLVAEAQQATGLPKDALGTADAALTAAAETGQLYWDAELHRLRGELLLELGSTADGERELRRAIEIGRSQGAAWPQLRAAIALARLLTERGQQAQARELLGPIHAGFTEGFQTRDLRQATQLLEQRPVEA